ncbi:hypothetical protein ETAA8_08100 [Anatilimnocola aggregata]|uniref:Uncharacterized protein n=1 Tax=Anatilimnocola aggregata TaxID=2528021 RepID=A0A517Y695_9BACT|nr:hypothetical protein [Anatilimnocola aggregata]QDU25740.1 hypothetical protein ETAA8_08100 [Anatilimnocola aggregata]
MNTDWVVQISKLGGNHVLKYAVLYRAIPATYLQVMQAWQQDEDFRSTFNRWLADVPYDSFRWETPPLISSNIERDFEFVVVDSPGLAPRADRQAFSEYFNLAQESEAVVTFPNLGRNAVLIVPCPLGPDRAYAHLGAFVRTASPEQCSQLWQDVGLALETRIGQKPVWLSTAGAGVSWLHVRLDDQPKYYSHGPYRVPPT